MNIIKKLKKYNIVGRGGAGFPAYIKWVSTKKAKGYIKYVICNASEGELGLCKDFYILNHFPETVIKGMVIAMDFLETKYAYFNFNQKYYNAVKKRITAIIKKYEAKGYIFRIFEEKPSYIGGEETALLNAIEGKKVQPRLKPPYPGSIGLFGQPTLIHNVETLFNISKVFDNRYEDKRFYSVFGKCKNCGVFYYDSNWSIKKILQESNNLPDTDFFVQAGGSASGPVYNKNQINSKQVGGAGSIEIYQIKERELLLKWFKFYKDESCGKCTPCREGSYQLYNIVKNSKTIKWDKILPIINTMSKTSFCALGASIEVPIKSYIKNIKKT